MKRDSGLCLGLFLGFILLLLGMLFEANGGDYRDHTVDAMGSVKGKPEDGGRKPEEGKKKAAAEITARAVKVDTGRKDAKGKAVTREFPVMFDIAKRSQDKRAQKQKKGADKK